MARQPQGCDAVGMIEEHSGKCVPCALRTPFAFPSCSTVEGATREQHTSRGVAARGAPLSHAQAFGGPPARMRRMRTSRGSFRSASVACTRAHCGVLLWLASASLSPYLFTRIDQQSTLVVIAG